MNKEDIEKNKQAMKEIFDFIEERAPLAAFCVLLFPAHNPKKSNWICRATRRQMVEAMLTAAERVQADIEKDRESPGTFYFEGKT